MGRLLNGRTEFTTEDFEFIRNWMFQRSGITLSDSKKVMVWRRLQHRFQELDVENFGQYRRRLEHDSGEATLCVNAITTNVTAFFREPQHFEWISQHLPDLIARQSRVRLWSAGCSTGEEPYSLAMVVAECLGQREHDVRILATDINTEAVEKARRGIYRMDSIDGLSAKRLQRHCQRGCQANEDWMRIRSTLKERVNFQCLNLQQPWPMNGPFDYVLCRNVAIYFPRPTQKKLLDRLAELLRPGGYLMLGHSESLIQHGEIFEWCGGTIYRRR